MEITYDDFKKVQIKLGTVLSVEKNEKEPELFESKESDEKYDAEVKEPELFDSAESEEDFEIPAFLRRQKN